MKNTGKQDQLMDSSHSDSPKNQSESRCPPYTKKRLIPDSTVISTCHASLRSAKKLNETRGTSVQAQVSECSVVELQSVPRQVALPSAFVPETRQEETEKAGDSVDVAQMKKVSEDENPVANHTVQMEEHNAFEALFIPFEQEHLEEDIEASNSGESSDKNNGKSISMVGDPSFSLNLTEIINMGNNEVNFVGQRSWMDKVEGYQVKKPECIPILRNILNKHGDVFKNSMVSTTTLWSIFLGVICDIISELEVKGLHKITEDELYYMITFANEMKSMKVIVE